MIHFVITCRSAENPFTELVKSNVPYLFANADHIPVWVAIFINLINVYATVVWNYLDIFIMIISVGLSTHFKLLNAELEQTTVEVRITFEASISEISNSEHLLRIQRVEVSIHYFRICLLNFG